MDTYAINPKAADWLKRHGAGERSFGRALGLFFSSQARRIAAEVADSAITSPEQVSLLFRADDEHLKLLPILKRNLGNLMALGADGKAAELVEKQTALEQAQEFIEGLPPAVRQRIRQALDELAAQDYWRAIQDTTQSNLVEIIKRSLDDGIAPYTMAQRIQHGLGESGIRRAKMIARTETTGAVNAGHDAVLQELGSELRGKEWITILDDHARENHVNANGQVVPVNGEFRVGPHPTPYPGHWNLPAGERIRCRCTVVGAFHE